jgi:alpha-galactosidase
MTKITFIGAGSVIFTKNLLGDILSFPELQECTIALHDIDPIRLETAERMARWTASALNANPQIEAYSDRRRALTGAQYVINMIQVGGHAATLIDFEIPRRYGLQQTIGDTHSIGGIFRALRTLPVVLDLATEMQTECPGALLINYTNPMSMLCWGVFAATSVPVVGLCHSVQHTTRDLAGYIQVPYSEVTYLGAGINHMSWILRFQRRGQDLYPLLWEALETDRIPARDAVRAEMYRRLGYYMTESSEHLAEYSSFFIPHPGQVERFHVPIDEYLRRSEQNLKEFEESRVRLLHGGSFEIKRSAEYASLIIRAQETNEPAVIYANVRNSSLIENLPEGCCVEVPCLVDGNGVQPTHIGDLPPHLAGLNRQHIAVQELIVRAVLEQNREYVFQAAMLDPLASAVLTLPDLHALVNDLFIAHGEAIPESLRWEQKRSPARTSASLDRPEKNTADELGHGQDTPPTVSGLLAGSPAPA